VEYDELPLFRLSDMFPVKVSQLTGMSCTLACFESFSAQNGGDWTQRAIISTFPDLCQGQERIPGYVLAKDYVELALHIGIQCEPIHHGLLPLPYFPTQAILIGAGNYYDRQHSLLWIRALPGDWGLAMDPDPNARNYLRFQLQQLWPWQASCWRLRV
jgi:hypothetical protein